MVFEIPNSVIYLDDASAQRMKVSLLTFSTSATWTEIDSHNNTITFDIDGVPSVVVTIPAGNYPFYELAKYITNSQSTIRCVWDMPSNKYVFTNVYKSEMSISFVNTSHLTFGFDVVDNGLTGTQIVSTQPITPRQNTELYVRMGNAILGYENLNLDNLTGPTLKPSNILCIVPISAAPYQHMFFENTLYGSDVGIYISNGSLDQLSIDITDRYGNYATFLGDWDATIKIEIFNVEDPDLDSMKASLKSINDTLQKLLMLKVIK